MTLSLYLIKIAVPPVLVALMSVIARRFGPSIGGLLMGLPWMTGPVLFFLSWDRDAAYTVRACTGVELGTIAIAAFILGYAFTSRIAPWFIALPAAAATFAATAYTTRDVVIDLIPATAIAIAVLVVAHFLIARPAAPTPAVRLPWWDIPARMLATFGLVAGIMTSSDYLGPQLSGVVASFPVILTVVGSFSHHQLGRDAVLRMHKGITISLIGFALFFFVIGSMTPTLGLVSSFAMGTLASLAFSGTLIILQSRQTA